MGTEKRQRQKQGHRLQKEELRRWEKRRRTRRLITIWAIVLVVVFGGALLLSALRGDDDESATSTTAAPASTTSTTALPAPTPCPPAEGAPEPVRAFSEPPPTCIEPGARYTAVLDTSEGEIRVDLDSENTPDTVNNFVVLARYGYYDGTPIFRTDPSIGIIQGGGQSTSDPGPGYTIPDEGDGFTYEPGQLVMARSDAPDSAGAQFFLVGDAAVSALDAQGTYVVFGNTDEAGLGVVRSILDLHEPDPASNLGGAPSREVTINSVTIEES